MNYLTKFHRMPEIRCFLLLAMLLTGPAIADDVVIERLTWAGIKLVSGDTTVLVDAVGTDLWDGDAPEGLVPVESDTTRTYALITHAHNDHFDVDTLKTVLGARGYLICHESQAVYAASRGLRVIPAKMYEPIFRGGFVFTAVPAEDGFGVNQVSWIISKGSQKFLHGGDTLWHGQWGNIGRQYGPFDAVFMPINGARDASENMPVTPAVQTPQQAVDAAGLLRAELLIPIHFGLNDPPGYVEVDKPLETLMTIAGQRGQSVRHLSPGEQLVLKSDGQSER
jgi:L-ascorbate metabolism protein UlaG (beta-lactamase superfamily)